MTEPYADQPPQIKEQLAKLDDELSATFDVTKHSAGLALFNMGLLEIKEHIARLSK